MRFVESDGMRMRSGVNRCIVPAARPIRGSGLGGDVDVFTGPVFDDEDDDIVAHAAANTAPTASDTARRGETGFTGQTGLGK